MCNIIEKIKRQVLYVRNVSIPTTQIKGYL